MKCTICTGKCIYLAFDEFPYNIEFEGQDQEPANVTNNASTNSPLATYALENQFVRLTMDDYI